MLFSLVVYYCVSILLSSCQKWWEVRREVKGAIILGLANALICILFSSVLASFVLTFINSVLYTVALKKR
jgi:hypothetical protein